MKRHNPSGALRAVSQTPTVYFYSQKAKPLSGSGTQCILSCGGICAHSPENSLFNYPWGNSNSEFFLFFCRGLLCDLSLLKYSGKESHKSEHEGPGSEGLEWEASFPELSRTRITSTLTAVLQRLKLNSGKWGQREQSGIREQVTSSLKVFLHALWTHSLPLCPHGTWYRLLS